jgi:hypothetical protein
MTFVLFQKEKINLFKIEPKFQEFCVFRQPPKFLISHNFFLPLGGLQGRNHSRAHCIAGERASKMETTAVAA